MDGVSTKTLGIASAYPETTLALRFLLQSLGVERLVALHLEAEGSVPAAAYIVLLPAGLRPARIAPWLERLGAPLLLFTPHIAEAYALRGRLELRLLARPEQAATLLSELLHALLTCESGLYLAEPLPTTRGPSHMRKARQNTFNPSVPPTS